jgi:hypothetical protein
MNAALKLAAFAAAAVALTACGTAAANTNAVHSPTSAPAAVTAAPAPTVAPSTSTAPTATTTAPADSNGFTAAGVEKLVWASDPTRALDSWAPPSSGNLEGAWSQTYYGPAQGDSVASLDQYHSPAVALAAAKTIAGLGQSTVVESYAEGDFTVTIYAFASPSFVSSVNSALYGWTGYQATS